MRLILAFLMTLIVSGCGTTTSYYLGARVAAEDVLPLPPKSATDLVWQDLYLRVDYSLTRREDRLIIAGNLSFADYPKMNLTGMHDLTLTLFLLNDQGRVRKYLVLSEPLGHSLEDTFPFRREIPLSTEISAMSFGYEGQLTDEMRARVSIWKRPQRTH